ncbi:MAG: tetratricopeptide repeat protein [Ferruginibacter sp.]|nr:tetratricopeptide repeat protein [Ferruginibacter sp.]
MKLPCWLLGGFMLCGFYAAGQNITQLKSALGTAGSDTGRVQAANQLAESYFINYAYDSCRKYANYALQLSNQLINSAEVKNTPAFLLVAKRLRAESVSNLASSFMSSQTEAAIDSFLAVEKYFLEIGDKEGLALTFQRLGETYANQNNADSSLYYLGKSLRLYQSIGNKPKVAFLYYTVSLTQRSMAMYGDALENNLQALSIARETNDSTLVLECILANGFIYMLAKDYPSALKIQYEGLNLARTIKDSSYIATVYSDLGNTNMRSGKLDAAFENFSMALRIRKRLNLTTYLSSNLLYLSNILVKQGKYGQAISYGLESLEYAKLLKDGRFLLDSYSDLANTYLLSGDAKNALTYFDSLWMVSTEYKDPFRQSQALQGMADVYVHQNQQLLAQATLQKAIHYTDSSDYRNLENIYERLGKSYYTTGEFKQAYLSSLQFKRFGDSVSVLEKAAKIASLTNQLEFQNKKALLKARQDKKLSEQQAEIRRQKLMRNIIIVGLIIAFIWVIIFFKRFREKRRLSIKLERTLEDLKSAQVQLVHSEKMASLGELTAGIAHEIQNPLNFVNNFSELNRELIEELELEQSKPINERDWELEKGLINDIKLNSEKINYHGSRADGIVKGMLQHSRMNAGQKEPTDINALADEYLRLSYHGLRAKDKSFNADFKLIPDERLGSINIMAQDIGRVILNLVNNAFYAVREKQKLALPSYRPLVKITTRKENNKAIIQISDNGSGIPKQVMRKVFQPFFTTKPTGEGTGLGLSLSYDIIKAHGGKISVNSEEGEGTDFIIELPIQ